MSQANQANVLQSLFQERRNRLSREETRDQKINRIFSIFWENPTFKPFESKLKEMERDFLEMRDFTVDQVQDYVNQVYNARKFISYHAWYEMNILPIAEFIDRLFFLTRSHIDNDQERRQLVIMTEQLKRLAETDSIDRAVIKEAYENVKESRSLDPLTTILPKPETTTTRKRNREEREEEEERNKNPRREEREEDEVVYVSSDDNEDEVVFAGYEGGYEAFDKEMNDEYARLLEEYEKQGEEEKEKESGAYCFY